MKNAMASARFVTHTCDLARWSVSVTNAIMDRMKDDASFVAG